MNKNNLDFYININKRPNAVAHVVGDEMYPNIKGNVWFYQTKYGVLVVADIEGLPNKEEHNSSFFAFHIHEGKFCSSNNQDNFANVGAHYNPKNLVHPYHAGDLPPLLSANGNAFYIVLTDRFAVDEIVNRTIIIHYNVDDFTTQPSGDAGLKIACGEIKSY